MLKKIKTLSLIVFISAATYAQKSNIFIDRAFWKTNPTIENIHQKIEEGHDISALSSSSFDAVSYALIEKVDNKTIQYLLSKKGNGVNKLTHDGRTYVFWAAYKDNLEMMRFLVENGADMSIEDSHGYSVLNFAATTGQLNTKLYDFCIENGADPTKEKNNNGANALLLVSPHVKDISLISYFTSKGIDMKTTDSDGNGLFNYAAKAGNIELMEYLRKQRLPYKKLNKQGENAMIFASRGTRNYRNTLESFQYLERLGISPNVITNKGITPLHAISYREKDLNIFKYFLSKGVDVNQTDEKGNTSFLNATYMNDLNIVQLLFKQVKDINYQNKKGISALSNAIQRNSSEVINFLLDSGADVTVKDTKGNNLSYYLINSIKSKNLTYFKEKITILSTKEFDVTERQKDGNSLYHLALDIGNTDLIKWVYSYKVDINTKNNNGITPLHKAVMTAKDDKMIQLLVSLGADITIKTDLDESSYDLASENELLEENKINIEFLK
tara:strand:- start:10305 stop:11801 length:1497 start_codon:yes stop_codon:yes gene_type:complete